MKPILNTQRSPKKGDWIKLERWEKFFQVARIMPMTRKVGMGIVFEGYSYAETDSYDINMNWIYLE